MKINIAHKLPESARGRKFHTSARAFLRWLVCVWLACVTSQAGAATYVIGTDGAPLLADGLQALGVTTNTPGYFFFSPTNLGSINGTPIRFGGYSTSGGLSETPSNTAVFAVPGNLTLTSTDTIIGVGTKFLRIEVGGDATIPAGAKITVQGITAYILGAGGGRGGWGGRRAGRDCFNSCPSFPGSSYVDGLGGSNTLGGVGTPGKSGRSSYGHEGNVFWESFGRNPVLGYSGEPSARGRTSAGLRGFHSLPYDVTMSPGGDGGAGGAMGMAGQTGNFSLDGHPGATGGTGGAGTDGLSGNPGGPAQLLVESIDQGGLYGGAGGGGGAQGAWGISGGQGGGGGGGGQGGKNIFIFYDGGGKGGYGGKGGDGGWGGAGMPGGHGGAGGGGFELRVRGNLLFNGLITARGGNGVTGEPGALGGLGSPGHTGYPGNTGVSVGGQGGDGGPGGKGGNGGSGGGGGGGAGGTIILVANRILGSGQGDVLGGTGVLGSAASGIYRVRSDVNLVLADPGLTGTVPSTRRFNPYLSYPYFDTPLNPGVSPNTTPVIHGFAKLVGGPDVFGLLSAGNLGVTPDTNAANSAAHNLSHPPNAIALVQRSDLTNPDTPNPQVAFINISPVALNNPALSVNRAIDPNENRVPQPVSLQVRGYTRESPFVTNAPGAQRLSVLPPFQTWLTYIRPGDSTITAVFTPYTTPVTNTINTSGSAPLPQNLWLLDTGLLSVSTRPPGSFFDSPPVGSDRTTNYLPVNTSARAGSGTPVRFQVSNAGRAGSLMSSLPGSDLAFTNLPANTSTSLTLVAGASVSFGTAPPISAQIVSDAGTVKITMEATVVGPQMQTVWAGNTQPVVAGQSRELLFLAQNVAGPYSLNVPYSNYVLNITGMKIVGADSNYFTIQGPTNGTVPTLYTPSGTTSDLYRTNRIIFAPTVERDYSAKLLVYTDVFATPGATGQVFELDLSTASVAPQVLITQQPLDVGIESGSNATFTVAASRVGTSAPLTYQWKNNGEPIFGANSSNYTTGPLEAPARFSCTVSAGLISTGSFDAFVTIIETTNTPYAREVLADQPLFYYRFDEQGGYRVFDSSTNQLHALGFVDRVPAASPAFGYSVGFHSTNQQNQIILPPVYAPGTTNKYFSQLTFEAWLRHTPESVEPPYKGSIFSGEGISYSYEPPLEGTYQFGVLNLSDGFYSSIFGSSSGSTSNTYISPVVTSNVWLHVVNVYDSVARKLWLYTNGVEAGLVNLDTAPPAYLNALVIGAAIERTYTSTFLDGQLDELAVYATALSPERIAAHYQASPAFTITQQPEHNWVQPGETASFSVGIELFFAQGTPSYQWERNGLTIPGAIEAVYWTDPVSLPDNGAHYRCVVSVGTITNISDAAVLTVVNTSDPYPQAVLADAPLLYYRLEEQGAPFALDSSANGFRAFTGSYSNVTAAPSLVPQFGSSASFGGSTAQASIAVPPIINPATFDSFFGAVTVEAWVKLNAWNNASIDPNDYGLSGLYCGNEWLASSFQFVAGNEALAMSVRDSYGSGLYDDYALWDATLFKTNQWMHLATVYDSLGKTFRLYVNGALAREFPLDNAPPAFLGQSHLGAWMGSDFLLHRFLDGQIDEFAVYGSALSAERIAAHYDAAISIQITQQPADGATSPGGTATFSVAAEADLPLRYQWYRDGSPIPDAINATYITDAVALSDNGASFHCRLRVGPFSKESATAYLTVIATNGAHAQAVLADNPLLYYRFEEQNGATIFDSSGHGYHGTASNLFHVPGPVNRLGSAAGFQGYNNFGNPGSIAVPALINSLTSDSSFNQVTLVTWVKLNDWNPVNLPGDFGRSTIFGSEAFPLPGAFGLSAHNFNEFSLDLEGSGSGGGFDFYPVYVPVFVPGVWLHLAAVYDAIGQTLKLYTNGALCETVTLSLAPPALLSRSHIGAWDGNLGILQRLLDGQVDELALFDTALSAESIAAQYQSAAAIQITQQPADTSVQPGGTASFAVAAQTVAVPLAVSFQWKRNGTNIINATNDIYITSALGFGDNAAQFQCVLTAGPAVAESAVAAVTVVDTNIPYAQAVLAQHPLLYYRMEEQAGSTALDSSGNGYHGTLANVTRAPGPAPWLGSAASFGGAAAQGNIAVPSLINPATSDSFFSQVTVEAWVKLNSWNEILDGAESGISAIFSGNDWPEGSFQFVARSPSQFFFGVHNSSAGDLSNDYPSTDYDLFTPNIWLHLATVYDSTSQTFRLYVNGALKEEVPLDVAPAANLSASHIGAWFGFDRLYRFLDGQVDELAVYGTALAPEQIAAHYQAAVAVRITQQPVDVQAPPGGSVSFTVAAIAPGATAPLQYEWRRDGIAIPNATFPTYDIPFVTYKDYGASYHCAVSAGPFTVESAVASLSIIETNTAYARAVLADQPLLYYRMEETGGSTVFDSSGHGFHGTRTNVLLQPGVWPEVGRAAGFQGTNTHGHIAVPTLMVSGSSSFSALTVEAWVRVNQWNENFDEYGLGGIFTGNGWPVGSLQFTAANANKFRFGVGGSTSAAEANDYEADSSAFATNVWLHLAAVYDTDARTFRFYTNGVEARRVDLVEAPPVFMTDAQIGAWLDLDGNLQRFFDGDVDEVAVYATALPPARIAAHYSSAFPAFLAISREGADVRLDWILPGAILQQNTNVANPSGWIDMPGANSPAFVPPNPKQKFFRLRKP